MKKYVFLGITLIIVLFFLTQLDDKLSADAKQWVNQVETPKESESYLYLNGIFANSDDVPQTIGLRLLEESLKLNSDASYEVIDYPESKKIILPEGALFCKTWEGACLETLFNTTFDVGELIQKHAILISRLHTFLAFDEYTTLTKPMLDERYPDYQYLMAAQRINVLEAIANHKRGQSQAALDALMQQFSMLRRSLVLQDYVVGKMVFLVLLADIVDVASVILQESSLTVDAISELTATERDFSRVTAREFAMTYYMFKSLDRSPDILQPHSEVPSWYARVIYKPNMTINASVPVYHRINRLASLTPAEFVVEQKEKYQPSSSKLRNYVGSVLVSMYLDYDEFIARLIDFNAKLVLFNHYYHEQADLATASNPYYPGEGPKIEQGKACFRGPLEDKRSLRCLLVPQ